jgi:hypothetical protein
MKRELWYCPHCPQDSTRRGNLKTHIERKHAGIGLPFHRTTSPIQYEDHMNFAAYFEHKQQSNKPTVTGRNNAPDSDPFATWDRNQKVADTLVEIKKHLSKNATPLEAHVATKAYLDTYIQTQDVSVLDNGLAWARRVARFADSLQQLRYQGITQSVPRTTSSTPYDTSSNYITDLGSIGADPLAWLQQQGSSPSITSFESLLASSMSTPSAEMRPPNQPRPTSQNSPSSSSCSRTSDLWGSNNNTASAHATSSTQKRKQTPDDRRKADVIKNQKHKADPYYSYYGVPKEELDPEFFAWMRQHSLQTLMS